MYDDVDDVISKAYYPDLSSERPYHSYSQIAPLAKSFRVNLVQNNFISVFSLLCPGKNIQTVHDKHNSTCKLSLTCLSLQHSQPKYLHHPPDPLILLLKTFSASGHYSSQVPQPRRIQLFSTAPRLWNDLLTE